MTRQQDRQQQDSCDSRRQRDEQGASAAPESQTTPPAPSDRVIPTTLSVAIEPQGAGTAQQGGEQTTDEQDEQQEHRLWPIGRRLLNGHKVEEKPCFGDEFTDEDPWEWAYGEGDAGRGDHLTTGEHLRRKSLRGTSSDTTDHPLLRAATTCPFCHNHKDRGLIACWSCYRSHDMRNGLRLYAQTIIADVEQRLRARQDGQ